MRYKTHKEIPTKYRKVILDETLEKRVSKVPLVLCNEIIEDYLEFEKSTESLKKFKVTIKRNGKFITHEAHDPEDALVILDREVIIRGCDFAMLRQAERIVKVFYKGQWMTPGPKDQLVVRKAS